MKNIKQILAASGILILSAAALSARTASEINRSQSRTRSVQSEAQQGDPTFHYKVVSYKRTPFEINRAQSATGSQMRSTTKSVITRHIHSSRERTPFQRNRLRSHSD